MLVPAGADAKVQAAMTERVDGAGHLCQQRRVAVAVTRHYLANTNALRIACKCSRTDPAFKGYFLCWYRNRVEMVVEPDRVKAQRFGFACDSCHGFIGLSRICYAYEVHAPPLGNNDSVIHSHMQYLFLMYLLP